MGEQAVFRGKAENIGGRCGAVKFGGTQLHENVGGSEPAMRVFYLDPGLRDDVGHHANYCRYIVGELRGRGVETLVFAHRDVSPVLQAEFSATPHFRTYTYTLYTSWDGWRGWLADFATYGRHFLGEPGSRGPRASLFEPPAISPLLQAELGATPRLDAYLRTPYRASFAWRGWLTTFAALTQITYDDLCSLPSPEPEDLVFATSVRPVQMSALIKWRRALPLNRRPTMVLESVRTGLVVRRESDRVEISMPDPRFDPIAALFRYAARELPREEGACFHFVAFAPIPTELFKMLLQFPVRTLPLPYRAVAPLRNRAGARPVVVAILGHQRSEKGYDRLPEIAQELLRLPANIRLLIQNVDPLGSPETQQALRAIATSSDRVVLEETPAGSTRWPQLLEMSDLILCPHRPDFYVGFSAVEAEALANGIPVVVPARTPLEKLLVECGRPGATFDRFEPASIAEATGRVVDGFDRFATLAHAAALRWPETRGPARLVEELISLCTVTGQGTNVASRL